MGSIIAKISIKYSLNSYSDVLKIISPNLLGKLTGVITTFYLISGDRVSFSYSCSKYVPMQDFTENSDIDWNKSIEEIDDMLSKKYGLTEDEERYIDNKIVSI